MKLWGSPRNITRRSWKIFYLEIIFPSMTFKRPKNQLRTDFRGPGKKSCKIHEIPTNIRRKDTHDKSQVSSQKDFRKYRFGFFEC